ncbi:hypothetical protein ACP70R_007239 [Stipagrostis hirtigluma subsp. patula]
MKRRSLRTRSTGYRAQTRQPYNPPSTRLQPWRDENFVFATIHPEKAGSWLDLIASLGGLLDRPAIAGAGLDERKRPLFFIEVEVIAGAKRKGACSFPSPADCAGRPCKRPSPAPATEEWRDWASLHADLAGLISARVLAADALDHMAFRAVCAQWRASAPRAHDPTLRDARLRPRGWVALCDGDGAPRRRLRGHRIVGFTDGLLILLHKATTAVRVLHPFTGAAVDLPPLAAVFTGLVRNQHSRAWMRATVCLSQSSPDSIAVVAWFPTSPVVVVAEPSFPSWHVVNRNLPLAAAAPFEGRLYGVVASRREVVQVYPERRNTVVAHIPDYSIPQAHLFFLVESGERLVLVVRHFDVGSRQPPSWACWAFAVFEVDTAGEQRELALAPVSSLGDRALFLGGDRCVSVSHGDLPSISRDAIYFHHDHPDPVVMYSVASGAFVRTSTLSVTHDYSKIIRPSVRPFTLADHLLTYCSHRHWRTNVSRIPLLASILEGVGQETQSPRARDSGSELERFELQR